MAPSLYTPHSHGGDETDGTLLVALAICLLAVLSTLAVSIAGDTAEEQARPRLICPDMAPSPIKRFEAANVVVGDDLYLFGGFDTGGLRATVRADVYDPQSNSWKRIADLPEPVTHAGIASDGSAIWVAGGFVGDHPGKTTRAVWRYDTRADRWQPGPPLPEERAAAPLVRHERTLHYFGGLHADRKTDAGEHWALDLDAPSAWQPRAPLPIPRNHLGGIELGGLIYAVGGQHGHDGPHEDIPPVHAYDPRSDTWRELSSLPYGRSHFEPGIFTAGGQIVIVGGRANKKSVVDDITAYDPRTNGWRDVALLDVGVRAPTAASIGSRVFIGLGGLLPSGVAPRATLRACELRELGLGPG